MRSKNKLLPDRVMTAFEMQRRPAAFQRQALQAPLTITSNGEPTLIVMSVEEYHRLCQKGEGDHLPPDGVAETGYPAIMKRNDAIDRIRHARETLARLGIAHVALFGSVARNTADELSDVDVVVDTADGRAPGLFKLAQIQDQLEAILGRPVDVISRRGLDNTKKLKRHVNAELVNVF
jgi:uncharacterized protein